MGTILYSRDGEGLYEHEGYVSPVLEDGSSTHGTWTTDIQRRPVARRAEYTCAWAGTAHNAGGPRRSDAIEWEGALQDWEVEHAQPLLRAAERVRQLESLAETVRINRALLRDGINEALARGATWNDIAGAYTSSVAPSVFVASLPRPALPQTAWASPVQGYVTARPPCK